MCRVRLPGFAAGVVLVLALAFPARAQDMATARRHFDRAESHYGRGEYELAFGAYQEAYAAAPLPDFLFNMGQCQRKLGNPQRAIDLYERFLETSTDPDRRRVARQVLDEIRTPARPDAGPRPDPAPRDAPSPDPSTSASTRPEPTDPGPPEQPGLLARIRVSTWLALGGGGVLLGVGGYFGLRVLDAQDELDSLDCTQEGVGPRCAQIENEADADFTKQIVFQTLGGAALALTVVLAILDITSTQPAQGDAFLLPRVGPGRLVVEGGARW